MFDVAHWARWRFAPRTGVASFLVYGVFGCGLAAVGVWLWARPRGLVGRDFQCSRPRPLDGLIAVITFVIGGAIFPLSQWLARMLFGASVRGMNFDIHSPYAIPAMFGDGRDRHVR